MKFLHILSVCTFAAVASADLYTELWDYCLAQGGDTYVGVLYTDGTLTSFAYDQCYPYAFGDVNAQQAVFCKNVICQTCLGVNCGDPADVFVPLEAGFTLVNPAGVVQLAGQGAICYQNLD